MLGEGRAEFRHVGAHRLRVVRGVLERDVGRRGAEIALEEAPHAGPRADDESGPCGCQDIDTVDQHRRDDFQIPAVALGDGEAVPLEQPSGGRELPQVGGESAVIFGLELAVRRPDASETYAPDQLVVNEGADPRGEVVVCVDESMLPVAQRLDALLRRIPRAGRPALLDVVDAVEERASRIDLGHVR